MVLSISICRASVTCLAWKRKIEHPNTEIHFIMYTYINKCRRSAVKSSVGTHKYCGNDKHNLLEGNFYGLVF